MRNDDVNRPTLLCTLLYERRCYLRHLSRIVFESLSVSEDFTSDCERLLNLRRALYNLEDDPRERAPQGARLQERPYVERLFADHAEASSAIRERLTEGGAAEASGSGAPPDISPEMEESLRALGYIE